MPYPVHNRFVVRGTFGNTPEIWSNTLHFESTFGGGSDNLPGDWDAGGVTAAIAAFYGLGSTASAVRVTDWRGYQIGGNGRLIGNNLHIEVLDPQITGSGSARYPTQIALVLSLLGAARGPASHGRVYLPGPTEPLGNDLRISESDVQTRLNNFQTYIESLKDAMYDVTFAGEALVNVSPIGADGVKQDVSEYRCGRVPDTLRTRRGAMEEDYVSLAA